MELDSYERSLLAAWEEVYKKGQLTLWILLSLKDGPKHMADIKTFIKGVTNGTLVADDKSMYRALRRYHAADMISFTTEPGSSGPDRKVYQLALPGQQVLELFIERNISSVFYQSKVRQLIQREGEK